MLLPTLRRSLLTTRARAPLIVTSRPFSQAPIRLARKDTQDKDSLKPEPNEYSKSGSDDAAAAVDGEEAFTEASSNASRAVGSSPGIASPPPWRMS